MTRFGPKIKSLEERFWSKVNKEGPLILDTPCYQWTGGTSEGYGILAMTPDPPQRAHVVAFFLQEGRWPTEGKHICHDCDNRLCVRHIYEGTPKTNIQDMVDRGNFRKHKLENEICPAGHTYDINRYGYRSCSVCINLRARKAQASKRIKEGKASVVYCEVCWYQVANCKCKSILNVELIGKYYESDASSGNAVLQRKNGRIDRMEN
jgi:hypothetical protein